MRALNAALALCLLTTGCRSEPSTEVVPNAGSGALDEGSAAPVDVVELRDPGFDATDGVELAVIRAQAAVAERVLELTRAVPEASGEAPTGRPVRILFGSNVHGELVDCGCPHHPLGGLARRATIADDEDADGVAFFHLDAGNTLFQTPAPLDTNGAANALTRAHAVAAGLSAANVPALVPGAHDLAGGADVLTQVASENDLVLLAANVTRDGAPLGPSSITMTDDGVSIAVVGVVGRDVAMSNDTLEASNDARPIAAAIEEARRQNPAFVVMLHTGGVGDARRLLDELEVHDQRPDLMLVSGSQRLMREVQWYRGVAISESDLRGKNLVVIEIDLLDSAQGFASPSAPGAEAIEGYLTALRAAERTIENMIRPREVESGALERRADAYARMRNRQMIQLLAAEQRFAEVDLGALEPDPAVRSILDARVVPVELEIAERADVKRIVDQALARMGVTR